MKTFISITLLTLALACGSPSKQNTTPADAGCVENQSSCRDDSSQTICEGGKWQTMACGNCTMGDGGTVCDYKYARGGRCPMRDVGKYTCASDNPYNIVSCTVTSACDPDTACISETPFCNPDAGLGACTPHPQLGFIGCVGDGF